MINNNILSNKLSKSIKNTLILTINLHFICRSTCHHFEFLQTLAQSGVPRGLGSKVRLRHLDKAPSSSNGSRETLDMLEDPGFAIRTQPKELVWRLPKVTCHINNNSPTSWIVQTLVNPRGGVT